MSIIDQQLELESVPDQMLMQLSQQPDQRYPMYLVAAESQRRKDLRDRHQAEMAKHEAANPPTVIDQRMNDLMNGGVAGVDQGMGGEMPPGQMGALQSGIAGGPPPGGPPPGMGGPPPMMAYGGGLIRGYQEGEVVLTPEEEEEELERLAEQAELVSGLDKGSAFFGRGPSEVQELTPEQEAELEYAVPYGDPDWLRPGTRLGEPGYEARVEPPPVEGSGREQVTELEEWLAAQEETSAQTEAKVREAAEGLYAIGVDASDEEWKQTMDDIRGIGSGFPLERRGRISSGLYVTEPPDISKEPFTKKSTMYLKDYEDIVEEITGAENPQKVWDYYESRGVDLSSPEDFIETFYEPRSRFPSPSSFIPQRLTGKERVSRYYSPEAQETLEALGLETTKAREGDGTAEVDGTVTEDGLAAFQAILASSRGGEGGPEEAPSDMLAQALAEIEELTGGARKETPSEEGRRTLGAGRAEELGGLWEREKGISDRRIIELMSQMDPEREQLERRSTLLAGIADALSGSPRGVTSGITAATRELAALDERQRGDRINLLTDIFSERKAGVNAEKLGRQGVYDIKSAAFDTMSERERALVSEELMGKFQLYTQALRNEGALSVQMAEIAEALRKGNLENFGVGQWAEFETVITETNEELMEDLRVLGEKYDDDYVNDRGGVVELTDDMPEEVRHTILELRASQAAKGYVGKEMIERIVESFARDGSQPPRADNGGIASLASLDGSARATDIVSGGGEYDLQPGFTKPTDYSENEIPRGVKNNNPMNLKDSGDNWQGWDRTSKDEDFLIFNDPESGMRAGMTNHLTHFMRGDDTVQKLLFTASPPSDNPNFEEYVNHVAEQTGVGRNEKIDLSDPAVGRRFAIAVANFELGTRGDPWGGAYEAGLRSAYQTHRAKMAE